MAKQGKRSRDPKGKVLNLNLKMMGGPVEGMHRHWTSQTVTGRQPYWFIMGS